MSHYSSRRTPVTQYLRDLEPAPEESFLTEGQLANELASFTNTTFFDIDLGEQTDCHARTHKPETSSTCSAREISSASAATADDVTPADALIDFGTNFDSFIPESFGFGDFGSNYSSPPGLQPLQPTQPAYPSGQSHRHKSEYSAPSPATGRAGSLSDSQRPDTCISSTAVSFEEQTRRLAEEDKRKRNTAASARFRIKKKQREQALERSAKEMIDKVNVLESRIQHLETENKFLRNLLTDKHDDSKDHLAKLLALGNNDLGRLLAKVSEAKEAKEEVRAQGAATNAKVLERVRA